MRPQVNSISGRLSLRPPQRMALEILDRVTEIISLDKGADPVAALAAIASEFASVTEFEREFPSLCFALATGVGKTRLMGAFIAYLYQAHDIRNFFVLAPNLTIYNKLIADFTPNTPKYVFKGIAEFAAEPPEIITGDNYESIRAIRKKGLYADEGAAVNIFNISKINAEVRGDKAPRIKRLSEYIGESYFDYLAGLPDLVLLMDESHRYRASAGVRAINELKPILGLELTATPQIEAGKGSVPFKNVIYSYPLSEALKDGFVKEPAVATRENFVAANYTPEQLEKLKLEDGVRIHENTKLELELYGRERDLPVVKPFMLIVAEDTTHAESLLRTIQDDKFFDGRYKDRVITVHSNKRGEEADETVERLLKVESPAEPTEIVIHVNMLKEGWDVTNLYTIVPLRAANSKTLVEQSIGRGLRLPYGKRVGVPAVDRLTIVAHDKFQAIIDEANNPGSIIRTGVVIGKDIPLGKKLVILPSILELQLTAGGGGDSATTDAPGVGKTAPLFTDPVDQQVAQLTFEVVKGYEYLASSADLQNPKTLADIAKEVAVLYTPGQGQLPGIGVQPDIPAIVAKTAAHIHNQSIDIPRITIVPSGEVTSGFNSFKLNVGPVRLQPVAQEILIHHLRTNARERLTSVDGIAPESRLEDYLVRSLMDFDDINYDKQSDLLYDLAGQMVAHLRSYLPDEDAVTNVLQYHGGPLAGVIHSQMQEPGHYWEKSTGLEAKVNRGFMVLKSNNVSLDSGEIARDFRAPVAKKSDIRGMIFTGFKRCLFQAQKFDSDAERRFAQILEDEKDDLKWLKPAKGQFQIHYSRDGAYEPDFVVETADAKYLCEPKDDGELASEEVQAKATAAALWCKHATDHAKAHGGKPWEYLLIPASEIVSSMNLKALTDRFKVAAS